VSLPEIVPLGSRAFIIRISEQLDRAANSRARSLADAIIASGIEGLSDVVAANSSIGVYCEHQSHAERVRSALAHVLSNETAKNSPGIADLHEIPVRYTGPDLMRTAELCGLTQEQVIQLHSSVEYQVFAIGFAPGFAYLGEVDERIAIPRRADPRTRVPAGSVAIANRQTAIYPFDTPGGWNIIGETSVRPFSVERAHPALFKVGDNVRFVPV
jgi:5-oxoprolinase (ATP-hydrolysing) subunit B